MRNLHYMALAIAAISICASDAVLAIDCGQISETTRDRSYEVDSDVFLNCMKQGSDPPLTLRPSRGKGPGLPH